MGLCSRVNLLFLLLAVLLRFSDVVAQTTADSVGGGLTMDVEIRPRAELTDGYRRRPEGSTDANLLITQRNRLNVTFTHRRVRAVAALQAIHVWTDGGDGPGIGSINAFELYVEPMIAQGLSLRVGRQALSLDNGRLFSAAPWAQQGRAHEGARLLFVNRSLSTDLSVFATRPYGERFDAAYSPVAAHRYTLLAVHHLRWRLPHGFTLTAISFLDRQPCAPGPDTHTMTLGGRAEYERGGLYATVSGHYQFGTTVSGQHLSAYYLQPEVRGTFGNTVVRLGAEVLSGGAATGPAEVSNSFGIDYGVAWKFMGNMNLFTRFPRDVAGRGLVNPYLFLIQRVGRKVVLRADGNLFFSQHPVTGDDRKTSGHLLGLENDLSINYRPSPLFDVHFGLSYLICDENMELLGRVDDAGRVPVWSYLMVSFNPVVLRAGSGRRN